MQVFLTQKTDTKFSKIRSGMFIPDPGSCMWIFSIPDPGSRVQKSTGSGSATLLSRIFSMHPLAGGRYYGHERATPKVLYHNVGGWEGS
jgi:hypothetical protein